MKDEKVLVFDVLGDYAFFKIPEVTRATVSFPFSRTSIIGIIGAIIGKHRNQYWLNDDSLGKTQIAIEFKNPINKKEIMINYTHTKNTILIRQAKIFDTTLPSYSKKGFRGFVTNVRLDLLHNVHYRIYFYSNDEILYENLKTYLKNNWCYFPPYLGHANLLANIVYIGEFPIDININEEGMVSTVIPTRFVDPNILKNIGNKFTNIYNVPIRIFVNTQLKILNVLSDNFILPGENGIGTINIKLIEKKISRVYLSETKIKNVIFLPTGFEPYKFNEKNIFNVYKLKEDNNNE
ncbi:MAG: type I-B CRISPR-associated protein Cas5b [Promethearchaeota archaeon]